jgi:hypothetical protein
MRSLLPFITLADQSRPFTKLPVVALTTNFEYLKAGRDWIRLK